MSYFRELPNILYQSNLSHKISSREYVAIKNIFRKVKIQDWIEDKINFFTNYTIIDGQRPDNVAEIWYGSADLDWIVVLTSGITNIKDEWPLSNYDLYRYAENKYGVTELNSVHHHETLEVKDNKGRLILLGGQKVDADFTIRTPFDASATKFYITDPDLGGGGASSTKYTGVNQRINPVTGISNYQYEVLKNEEKRDIKLMKPIYLQLFLQNMRTLMSYEESSQSINSNLAYTEKTRLIT